MTMMKTIHKLFLLLCLIGIATYASASPEAEYKKVSKTWILHDDGSQEYRHYMELTLFTHTAMNSTYGESFIVYDPTFQSLKINASYTKQKDGTIIRTPDNAFVEVLPRFAANAPAYNQLKEMVVVHTGLELGATIYLDYSILTKAGYSPALDICERLQESSPVKECEVTISVPENTPLTWELAGSNTAATETSHDGMKDVSWKLRNLPAASREPFLPQNLDGVPRILASTYPSNAIALLELGKRFGASLDYESKTFGPYLTEKASDAEEKLKILHDYVVNQMGYVNIPLRYTGFAIRDVDLALRSAYGTLAEKTHLLNVLLNAAGIQSEVVAVFPGNVNPDACGLNAVKTFAVKATIGGKERYLSATSLVPSSITARGELDKVISLKGIAVHVASEPLVIKEEKEINLSKEQAKDGYVVCTLPALSKGIDSWGMGTLNSQREGVFEIPSPISEEIIYKVYPKDGMVLKTALGDETIEKPFGKVSRTIRQAEGGIEVVRRIELNKQQFTPNEYKEARSLIQEWTNPNNRVLLFSL